MENNRGRSKEDSEDDDDEEKDEDEKESNKKTTKIPRRLAGLSLTDKEPPATRQEEKVARIIDTLFKEKTEKPEEDEEEEPEEAEEPPETTQAEISDELHSTDILDSVETETPESEDTELIEEEPHISAPESLEAPFDWEEEGEFDEDAEISLQSPRVREEEPLETPEVPSDTEEDTVEEEPVLAVDDGGETPPPDEPEDTSEDAQEPEPIRAPRIDTSASGGMPPYEVRRTYTPEDDAHAHEEALNDAEYYGEKRGQNRGVVAGLAAGLYLGHRSKKKQGKEYEAKLENRDTKIQKLENEQYAAKERIDSLKRNQETIQSALVEQAKNPPQAPLEAPTARFEADKPLIASILEGNKEADRQEPMRREVFQAPIAEKRPEKELPPEEREITEETYQTAEGRHVESSSWHRIEVDEKTGHVVENPDVTYGEEFRHETQKEILAASKDDAKGAAVQLGSMATTASAMGGQAATPAHTSAPSGSRSQPAASSVPTADQSTKPSGTDTQVSGISAAAKDPIMWAAGVALIVILIILASLL